MQAWAVLLLWLALSATAHAAAMQSDADEYRVEAAFLFHFAQLVEWPDAERSGPDSSLTVCLFADEPGTREVKATLDGKTANNRVLKAHVLGAGDAADGCDILFFSGAGERRDAALLKALRGRPVLAVGESESFLSDGGTIRLHLEDDHIHFDINLASAESSRLKISSRLLLLASSVKRVDMPGRGR